MIYHAFLNMIMLKRLKLVLKTYKLSHCIPFSSTVVLICFLCRRQWRSWPGWPQRGGCAERETLRRTILPRPRHPPPPKTPLRPRIRRRRTLRMRMMVWWRVMRWKQGRENVESFLREKCCPEMTLHRSAGEEGGVEEVSTAFNSWLCCFQWCQVVELWLVNFSVRNVQLIQFISSYRPWSPTPS